MQIDPQSPDPKHTDPPWLTDYNESHGNPYEVYRPYGGSCAVGRSKCCRWQMSRLEREYESEIRGRERILLGWFYKSRLQACVIGWAIAKGQDPADAKQFATHVQYH